MDYRINSICIMVILLTVGCSDDSSGPGDTGVTIYDILSAPVGTIDVDGQTVSMKSSYRLASQGEPLKVLGALDDPGATVVRLWFVSGLWLERDDDPQACFIPNWLCVSHVTDLRYEVGTEFVVALDVEASDGEILRVRSELMTVERLAP